MKKLVIAVLGLLFGAFIMNTIIEAGRHAEASPFVALKQASAPTAGSAVVVEPFTGAEDAGSASAQAGSATVTVNAGSGSTVVVTPTAPAIPDPVEDTEGALAALVKLYKDGALTPFFIVLGFFSLVYAERKVAWLRTGYRKVVVSTLLYGGGMLVERAISGTTPNLSMIVGALGAAMVFAFKSYGAKPTEATA